MNKAISYEVKDGIGVITVDDGKVNVMSLVTLDEISSALDRAEKEGVLVVIRGREGIFSAGFDLKVLASGPSFAKALVRAGADLAKKVLEFPLPVVIACTGHAFPMGAFILLAADYRIGVAGNYRIGLNEVKIGLTVPQFAIELARNRLAPSWYDRTVLNGEMFGPEEAMQAGFLDEVVSPDAVVDSAIQYAIGLKTLDMDSYRGTKKKARAPVIALLDSAIREELTLAT